MFENQLELQRIEKAQALNSLGQNPYPHYIKKEISLKDFTQLFSHLCDSEQKADESSTKCVNGRIKFLRHMGKAAFAKIEDESGTLQIYFSKDALGEEWFTSVKKLVEVGDIISVKGYPFVTKTGELSLHVQSLKVATKSIIPLPEKFHGLTDKELRYSQRYLDMSMNSEVREDFQLRETIVKTISRFCEDERFLGV